MIDGPRQTYIDFKKADWACYACDDYPAEAGEGITVEHAEKTFRKAVHRASSLYIPAGRIQHFQPTLPASAMSLTDQPDRKRRLNPADKMLNDINKLMKKWWWKTNKPNDQ